MIFDTEWVEGAPEEGVRYAWIYGTQYDRTGHAITSVEILARRGYSFGKGAAVWIAEGDDTIVVPHSAVVRHIPIPVPVVHGSTAFLRSADYR